MRFDQNRPARPEALRLRAEVFSQVFVAYSKNQLNLLYMPQRVFFLPALQTFRHPACFVLTGGKTAECGQEERVATLPELFSF